jgi:hypothetical protein
MVVTVTAPTVCYNHAKVQLIWLPMCLFLAQLQFFITYSRNIKHQKGENEIPKRILWGLLSLLCVCLQNLVKVYYINEKVY